MIMSKMGFILAMGQSPSASGSQQDPRAAIITNVGFLVIMVVLFYFVLIRPQSKKAKDHANMLKTVRSGDKVVTSGGLVGVVITVKEKTLTVRSADSKFEVTKSAVTEITERGEGGQS